MDYTADHVLQARTSAPPPGREQRAIAPLPPDARSPDSASLAGGCAFRVLGSAFQLASSPVALSHRLPFRSHPCLLLRHVSGISAEGIKTAQEDRGPLRWLLDTVDLAGRLFVLARSKVWSPLSLQLTSQQIRKQVPPEGGSQCHLLSQKVPARCSEVVPPEVGEVARYFCKRSSPTHVEDRQIGPPAVPVQQGLNKGSGGNRGPGDVRAPPL